MKRALLAASLLLAPAANAAPFTTNLNMAYNLAVKHVGEPHCTTVERAIVPDALLEGREGAATLASQRTACQLWIRRSLAAPRAFGRACAVMFHEVGHLNGYEHTTNRRSLMHPRIGLMPRECWRRAIWLLNRRNR